MTDIFGDECWVEEECHELCAVDTAEVLEYNETCTKLSTREDNEKLVGEVPAELWTMDVLCESLVALRSSFNDRTHPSLSIVPFQQMST